MADNQAILLLGSNIDPARNIQKALVLLDRISQIQNKSRLWITEAVGSTGPDFLNMSVEIKTCLNANQIKTRIINPVETELKRVRTEDKYMPRTIDLDLIIFNDEVLDLNIWSKLFIALPVSEINPDLFNLSTGKTLSETVDKLKSSAKVKLFKEIN
jgi:2-amino-4-hydroxy-6-hydroxymethyldihydropteridine diphosphokinase